MTNSSPSLEIKTIGKSVQFDIGAIHKLHTVVDQPAGSLFSAVRMVIDYNTLYLTHHRVHFRGERKTGTIHREIVRYNESFYVSVLSPFFDAVEKAKACWLPVQIIGFLRVGEIVEQMLTVDEKDDRAKVLLPILKGPNYDAFRNAVYRRPLRHANGNWSS